MTPVSPEIKQLFQEQGWCPQFVTYSVEFARDQLATSKSNPRISLDGSLYPLS